MKVTAKNIRISDGTSQDDRFPIALQEGYVNVDERSYEDLLALGAEHAQLLNYYTLNDMPGEGWEAFFNSDAAVIMARMQTTDLVKIESRFRNVFLQNMDYRSGELKDIPNYHLAEKIDGWLKALKAIESKAGQQLVQKIAALINKELRRELGALVRFLSPYHINAAKTVRSDFDRLWLNATTKDQHPLPDHAPPDETETIDHFLKSNFYAFYNAVIHLKESARILLPLALKSQSHDSAVGMYIAFAKLFNNVQQKVNQFTRQHLNFYYYDVLKIQPRKIIPDSTYLIFQPDVPERKILIPHGTEFPAGVGPDNEELIYRADNDLTVNGTTVAALATLCFERDPLISPEWDLAFSSGAKINRIAASQEAGVAPDGQPRVYPTFGAPKSASGPDPLEDADFGFAVASSVLLLKEGQRDITVAFRIEFPPASGVTGIIDFVNQIKQIIQKNEPAATPPEGTATDAAGQDPFELDAFFKAFRHMFTIHLTTETDWYEVGEYLPLSQVVEKQYDKNSLSLQFRLSPEVAAVAPYSPEIHGGQFDTDLPVIRFMINPGAYLYPYSLLKRMVVKDIEIEVDVKGVREVLLYNNLGQLDPNGPFYPFGPAPSVGSYFIIGNFEAARKQLTRFEVALEWGDLPVEAGGFQEYYQSYEMPFDNTVFAANIAVLNSGRWQPAPEEQRPRVKLFHSGINAEKTQPSGRISKERRLACDAAVPFFKPIAGTATDTEFGYTNLAKNGFFKFTLTDPAFAFGHKDYPVILAEVMTANSKLKKVRLVRPLPTPPYTPQINVISINYQASARINFAQLNASAASLAEDRLFHIHPFGVEELSPATHRTIRLLPSYDSDSSSDDSDGNLFIGLSAVACSGILTLFFHLREDSTAAATDATSQFKWYYLASNLWKPLESNQVIADTTCGFQTSGIVTLDVPPDINRNNSSMPDGLFWLRVSVDKHPESPCSLYAVFAQALQVSWRPEENLLSHLQTCLPAGTIKESRISIPGIAKINQIVDSFGGRLPESPAKVEIRVSERLKHKNRASTAWDYERLILERFPEIFKVKCFDNMDERLLGADPENFTRPGHILIVIVPHLNEQLPGNLQPMASGGLLTKIREFVKKIASPFARIKVRNPTYELIQIKCTIKPRPGLDEGYTINTLNQAINEFLSPWNKTGYHARFGWQVRRYDLESYIRHLEYIETVEKFSMLRIVEKQAAKAQSEDAKQAANAQSEDAGPFELFDTVSSVHSMVISTDGQRLVTTGSDNTARVWDICAREREPAKTRIVLDGHQGDVLAAVFSPDSRRLVTTSSDHTARIWDLNAEDPARVPQIIEGHEGAVLAAAFSPDGRRLVTTSFDRTVRIWDLKAADTTRDPQILEGHEDAVLAAAFSPDSRRLVTTSSDHTARIWDLKAEDPARDPQILKGHEDAVLAVVISPDGRRLVTTSHDNTVRIWDFTARDPSQTQRVLRGHKGTVLAVAFTPDGRRLVTAGGDNTARSWDLDNADRYEARQVFKGHDDTVLAVAISPDNRQLVTASSDNTVRLWDMTAGKQVPPTLIPPKPKDTGTTADNSGNTPRVIAAAVTPDRRRLATASSDNTVRLWDLTAAKPDQHITDLGSAGAEAKEIHFTYPWSIAVPVQRHFIKTTAGTAAAPPRKTGIDELEIGSTFIITGKKRNGQKK